MLAHGSVGQVMCSSSASLEKAVQRQRDSPVTLIPVQCSSRKIKSKTIKMFNRVFISSNTSHALAVIFSRK